MGKRARTECNSDYESIAKKFRKLERKLLRARRKDRDREPRRRSTSSSSSSSSKSSSSGSWCSRSSCSQGESSPLPLLPPTYAGELQPKSLSKSKEQVSDEAEEKLLDKETEAKVTTRVDMADDNHVVEDHRNGDAKMELDANKRQFSGLTKEELLKYADDPFWVRLRWFMFVMFWALWLCMLIGAIVIILRAPRCAAPEPRTWYEIGPLADLSESNYDSLEQQLPALAAAKVAGVFINPCKETYQVLEQEGVKQCLEPFKKFVKAAKEKDVKVIVDLTANSVPTSHSWFVESAKKAPEYDTFFIWAPNKGNGSNGEPLPPNNWKSLHNAEAWQWNEGRKQWYLHQYQMYEENGKVPESRADLNLTNPAVVARFDRVLAMYMAEGASGVRLQKARQLLVNPDFPDEETKGDAFNYDSLKHAQAADRPELRELLAHFAAIVSANYSDAVFTIAEDLRLRPEWYRTAGAGVLRPPGAAPLSLVGPLATDFAAALARYTKDAWPALQLAGPAGAGPEVAVLAMMLPAAPVLAAAQLEGNQTTTLAELADLRREPSLQFGRAVVAGVPRAQGGPETPLLAAARWKEQHTGYVVVWNNNVNASETANLTLVQSLPDELRLHLATPAALARAEYTKNQSVNASSVVVPAGAALVFSYVPRSTADQ